MSDTEAAVAAPPALPDTGILDLTQTTLGWNYMQWKVTGEGGFRTDTTVTMTKERIQRILLHVTKLVEQYRANEGNQDAARILNLTNIQLTYIPEPVLELASLESLWVDYNRLIFLPAQLEKLTSLTRLQADNNQIKSLPRELCNLTQLVHLDVSHNQLSEIPPEIGQLRCLHTLNVNYNNLSELPRELGKCQNLNVLHASFNHISELPVSLGGLTRLQQLYCMNNQLTDFPVELCALALLTDLWLSENQIEALPAEIQQLRRLKNLILSHNPILDRTIILDTDSHTPVTPLPLTHQILNWAHMAYNFGTGPPIFHEQLPYLPEDLAELISNKEPTKFCSECRKPFVYPLEYTCIKDMDGRRLPLKNRLCGIECVGILKRNLEFQRRAQLS